MPGPPKLQRNHTVLGSACRLPQKRQLLDQKQTIRRLVIYHQHFHRTRYPENLLSGRHRSSHSIQFVK